MKIKELTIENFKGVKHLQIALNGKNALIKGCNGSGKSTIADAISWCLFGKSSGNLTDFGIRPVNGNKEEDSIVRIVTDNDTIIKRSLHEKWQKAKGTNEVKYKGTETNCEWNEIPVTVTEFKRHITEMFPVGDEVFKLCTQPDAFFRLSWQAQKEILLRIAGEPTADEVGMEDFIKELNGKSVEEFKAIIAKQKKPIKEDFETIPARIDEASKLKKTATQADKDELEAVSKRLDNLRNAGAGVEEIKAKASSIRQSISKAQTVKQTKIQQSQSELAKLELDKAQIEAAIKKAQMSAEFEADGIRRTDATLEAMREEYMAVYKQKFEGDGICPVCKQPYPQEKLDEFVKEFNNNKAEKLKAINDNGIRIKKENEERKARMETAKAECEKLSADLAAKQNEIDAFKPADTTEDDAKIKSLMEEEAQLLRDFEQMDNSQQIKELEAERARLLSLVNVDDFNASIDARIEELRTKQKADGDELARLESLEYKAKEYAKRLVDAVEGKINKMFTAVRFKFADYTIDGGYVETCKATDVNGVEFRDINTAAQINAGIEVINVLGEFYHVDAPLIIDNRERVTDIIACRQQVISLAVDKDSKTLSTNILN